jgi:hypothetical protein
MSENHINIQTKSHSSISGVSIRFLKQYLAELQERKKFWHSAVIHAQWVDNGKGGACNCPDELMKAEAKIAAIEYVLKNGC